MTPGIAVGTSAPARWKADLALAIVALVWGTTFVVVKGALADISTIFFLALRFSGAAACMLLLFQPAFRRAGARAVWEGLKGGATAGVLLWLGYILQTFGLKFTTAGNSGFLTGLYIVLVPLFSAIFLRRAPQRRELLGLSIAVAGMLLLTGVGVHLRLNIGDLLTVACAVAFAIHLLLLGHYAKAICFEAVALGQIACCAALSTFMLFFERPVAHWNRMLVFALILTSVFATAVAFALQTWGQRYTTATRTALIFALEPVFALVTAVTLGGEPLTAAAVGGGVLILAGILLVEVPSETSIQ